MKTRKSTNASARRPKIEWREILDRLEANRAAIERDWEPEPDEAKRILRTRAQVLAREPARKAERAELIEVVELVLAEESYAVESAFVREVYSLKELTPLPCTPPFVLGIINVRGQILPIIDLKRFFGLPEKGLTDLNRVVVLHSGTMEFGVLADRIVGTRSVAAAELQGSLPTLTGIREQYLKGVTAERLVILDAARLLADDNILVHEQVEAHS